MAQGLARSEAAGGGGSIDLDAAYPRIAPRSWAVLRKPGEKTRLFRVTGVDTLSRSAFSLSARVTRLSVEPVQGDGDFGMRETAVFAESEELAPAPQVIAEPVEEKTVELEGLVGGLLHGRAVIVQGQRMRVRVDGDKLTLKALDGSGEIGLKDGETLEVLERPVRQLFSETWRLRDRDGFEGTVTLSKRLFLALPHLELPHLEARVVSLQAKRPLRLRPGVPGGGFDLPPVQRELPPHLTLVPAEKDDPVVAEVAFLDEIASDKERTTLKLAEPLRNLFDRATVSVLANVAPATHGETRREVLGSGDAAKRFQRFRLRQKPLTYGRRRWREAARARWSCGSTACSGTSPPTSTSSVPGTGKYVLRRDDDGSTAVRSATASTAPGRPAGGERGGRLPHRHRPPGLVGENRIALLATRPLGVKSVDQPGAGHRRGGPRGARSGPPERPMTVLTLDRVVSLRDFEDFARSFSGIGKAQARMLWAGGRRLVHLTVAGVDGAAVEPGSALDRNFREALDRLRDPFQALVVESYEHLLFRVRLKVKVDADYVRETVLAGVEAALREAFSFAARDFGQGVFLSEVMAVAQGRDGGCLRGRRRPLSRRVRRRGRSRKTG